MDREVDVSRHALERESQDFFFSCGWISCVEIRGKEESSMTPKCGASSNWGLAVPFTEIRECRGLDLGDGN